MFTRYIPEDEKKGDWRVEVCWHKLTYNDRFMSNEEAASIGAGNLRGMIKGGFLGLFGYAPRTKNEIVKIIESTNIMHPKATRRFFDYLVTHEIPTKNPSSPLSLEKIPDSRKGEQMYCQAKPKRKFWFSRI